MSSEVWTSSVTSSSTVPGSGAVAFFARPRVAGASAALAGRDLAAVAAFAGLAAVRAFVVVPDSDFAAVVLVARFAGADPLADFAAGAFLAGVLVAVRFTGSSVAGRAFVAATYTLSILQFRWARSCTIEKRRPCRILAGDLAALPDAGADG